MSSMRFRRLAGLVTTGLAALALSVFLVVFLGGRSGGPQATGTPGDNPAGQPVAAASPTEPPPPPICPLTGVEAPRGVVPSRPALAVKVENLPEARPQVGLSWADIVYEEPVEANITRFIVVYQCQDASRVEPVRSARFTDADILTQFGHPLIAYSGGVPKVHDRLVSSGLVDASADRFPRAYGRDPARAAPHDLYTSTKKLWAAAGSTDGAPDPVFTYTDRKLRGRSTSGVRLPFSTASDVYWRWDAATRSYLRSHADVPHTYSDGSQVSTTNVVVQVVDTVMTDVKDVNGVSSPEVVATGSGKAYVFRGGKVVEGKWIRKSLKDVTRFVDGKGREIPLRPGTTWVELFPSNLPLTLL